MSVDERVEGVSGRSPELIIFDVDQVGQVALYSGSRCANLATVGSTSHSKSA